MRKFFLVLFIAAATSVCGAQARVPYLETSTKNLTGVLSQDLFPAQPDTLSHKDSLGLLESRSAFKAGFFSLLIPGAGQIYNGGTGNYLKAAGFLAIEAAAIAANIVWTNKGNNQTTAFQNYANSNYSVLRYAQWIQLNLNSWDPNDAATQKLVSEMFINNGSAPWQKVDFEKLNEVENILAQTSPGQFFAHNLAAYGTQDYYEIIGKYPQFREGWSDATKEPWAATTTTYGLLKDSVAVSQDNNYMDQRAKANNFYGVAGTAIGVVIANHFLSAIEAAVWAHGHNKLVQTSVGVTPLPNGLGYQTQLNVAVNF